jgi:hypothetical protein
MANNENSATEICCAIWAFFMIAFWATKRMSFAISPDWQHKKSLA